MKRLTKYCLLLLIASSFKIYSQSYYPSFNSDFNYLPLTKNYFENNIPFEAPEQYIKMDSLISTSYQGYKSRNLFEYDNNGNLSVWLMLDSTPSGWQNTVKDMRFYDQDNNLITELNLGWSTNSWDSLTLINNAYTSGKITQSVFQDYDLTGWRNISRSSYVYSDGNVKSILHESWVNNLWQNNTLITYFYTGSSLRDSILFQMWDGNQWQDDKKTIFYSSSNSIDVDSMIVKSRSGSAWISYYRRNITNDENHNQIEQTDLSWEGNRWENIIRRYYSYNEYHYLLTGTCVLWINNQWLEGDGDLFISNPDGFTVAFITNQLNAYYSNVTSVNEIKGSADQDYFLSENYPNPFNPTTRIRYHIPQSGYIEIKIFDALGNEAAVIVNEFKSSGEYEVEWNASEFTSGIYFYQIKAGSFIDTKKMILLK